VVRSARVSQSFKIPSDFRAFMKEVAAKVDWGDRSDLVGPEALQHECGRGGLVGDTFRFTYLVADPGEDGHAGRWEISLREQQIRDIANGLLEEVDAIPIAEGTRVTRGDALLVWGEYDDDALRVRTPWDLGVALDAMFSRSVVEPCIVRLWSTGDEQAVVAMSAPDVAVYIVSGSNYGRSVGDPTRTDQFELVDHDVGPVQIPCSDCIPWRIARPALMRFAERGELGDEVLLDGSLPTQFLMLGDYDRDAELATRRDPAADPALSSIPRKAPHGGWAKRLVHSLLELQLIEIDMHIVEAIISRVAILLVQSGDDAIDSPEVAQKLAKEIERVRGIGALFATGGDLQIALRRTQDPPTQPVEIPIG
jgi:hypothetical protein